MRSKGSFLAPALAALALLPVAGHAGTSDYEASINQYRKDREDRLKADGGWLSVAGLYWLEEGKSTVGTDPSSAIVLPEGSAPARVGVTTYRDGVVTIEAEPGVGLTCRDEPVATMTLRSDMEEETDILAINDLTFYVIERGEKVGIRLKDLNSRFHKEFTHLNWYPIEESMRIKARWVPHDPPGSIRMPNILGTVEEAGTPGHIVWNQDGREITLTPIISGERLWFIFKDATSGDETYGAGRYLYTDMPADGYVIIDFNKAYNMPCVFTPYATCTFPPEENRLEVPIRAGEMNYGEH